MTIIPLKFTKIFLPFRQSQSFKHNQSIHQNDLNHHPNINNFSNIDGIYRIALHRHLNQHIHIYGNERG